MSLWLSSLGAKVSGYSLEPPTKPSLFELANVKSVLASSTIADIRDLETLTKSIASAKPDLVFHMAAQPLVRDSYKIPVETYSTNVMGTVHILEAVRKTPSLRAFINITTDKVYENKEWEFGYREHERLGGFDPYSNSKACSELVTMSYQNSYFNKNEYSKHKVGIATVRAGNVIGGGDFANDRLIPDIVRSILEKKKVEIRNPNSIRPWQHVLEPIMGYLTLAEKLYSKGKEYGEGWNFGPEEKDAKPVLYIVKKFQELSKEYKFRDVEFSIFKGKKVHEANYLKLDISKVKSRLSWSPKWNLETALEKILVWTIGYAEKKNVKEITMKQIEEYSKLLK